MHCRSVELVGVLFVAVGFFRGDRTCRLSATIVRSHAQRVLQRLVEADSVCADAARPEWLACLVALAEVAGERMEAQLPMRA